MKAVVPSVSYKVLGVVDADGVPSLALGVDGSHGAFLCDPSELHPMRRLLSAGCLDDSAAGVHTIDAHEALVRTLGASSYSPSGGFVTLIMDQLSLMASTMAAEVAALERVLLVSDRLKRQRQTIRTTFPYHCGSDDHAQKKFFCIDESVCGQFIPSIQHGDKVLTQNGIATFIGIGECGSDWAPYWHCSGSAHATMWLEGHLGRRIVVGSTRLEHNGPSQNSAAGMAEDVSRYLLSMSESSPFDESRWLNEGLFGVSAGDTMGEFTVLGVGPSQHFPSSRLELYLRDAAANEIVPLHLTRGLPHLLKGSI